MGLRPYFRLGPLKRPGSDILLFGKRVNGFTVNRPIGKELRQELFCLLPFPVAARRRFPGEGDVILADPAEAALQREGDGQRSPRGQRGDDRLGQIRFPCCRIPLQQIYSPR